MMDSDKRELDELSFTMDVIEKGQGELGLDYMDIVKYLRGRGTPKSIINKCFSTFAGQNLNFCGSEK